MTGGPNGGGPGTPNDAQTNISALPLAAHLKQGSIGNN